MKSKQLKSKISAEGLLTISIDEEEIPEPKDGEVLIKVQATPINPSDLGLLVGPADISSINEIEKGKIYGKCFSGSQWGPNPKSRGAGPS